MGSDSTQDRHSSVENASSCEVEAESNNNDSLEVEHSSVEDSTSELQSAAEVVTRIELDIARSSEKLVNLGILVMHVASRGNDFETFVEEEHTLEGFVVKASEFGILYGILDSEVRELESILSVIQTDMFISRDVISSINQPGDILTDMEDRLQDCEDSLKQSFEHVADLEMQFANFERILLAVSGKDGNKSGGLENGSLPDLNVKIKMQTAEQQRSILKMLEKSLGREMDLEKRLTESRELIEDLKLSLEQQVFCIEQEAEDTWGRLFEAENSAEMLLGISKELSGQIQVANLSINGSIQREGELRSELQDFIEQLKEKDCALQFSENSRTELVQRVNSLEQKLKDSSEAGKSSEQVFCVEQEAEEMWGRLFQAEYSAEILLGISKELSGQIQLANFSINGSIQREEELRSKLLDFSEQLKEKDCAFQFSENSRTELVERVNSLEQKLKDSSDQNNKLKEKSSEAEKRAEIAETECKLLREANMELNTDLNRLKNSITDTTNRVEQLEMQLKESEMKQLHAVASAEASQEKQIMLDCTIKDMENLIRDLKSKVLRAENHSDSAEEKCIILSESNAELIEDINFLRHRMKQLEASLHQADESKNETAKDIRHQTKLITDLVLQLALERERLHKQISSLSKEKSIAMKYVQQMKDPSATMTGSNDAKVKKIMRSENDITSGTPGKESNGEIMESTTTNSEMGNSQGDSLTAEIKTGNAVTFSEVESVRNIDARQLNFKHVFMIVVAILVIPAFAAFLFSTMRE